MKMISEWKFIKEFFFRNLEYLLDYFMIKSHYFLQERERERETEKETERERDRERKRQRNKRE